MSSNTGAGPCRGRSEGCETGKAAVGAGHLGRIRGIINSVPGRRRGQRNLSKVVSETLTAKQGTTALVCK